MAIRVYSTLTNGTEYAEWETGANNVPVKARSVVINGGAGLAQKLTLLTPLGVATVVTAEELEFLEGLESFQRHKKLGFMTVRKSGNVDPDVVAKDMEPRDGASPLMPTDFSEEKRPTSGKEMPQSVLTTAPRYKPSKNAAFR